MVRSPAPDLQLLCVKCGRDTSAPLPNGTTTPAQATTPPPGYHPFINGEEMDSDLEEEEAGVMQVERAAVANQRDRMIGSRFFFDNIGTRREQSDRAAKLIGEKLLQGYTLLEEICPTPTCYGV